MIMYLNKRIIFGWLLLGGQLARLRAFAVGWFIVAVLALSAFFYPVWTAETIPEWYRRAHVWLTTW